MDSWEWNKIAGAVLGTLIFVLVIKFATESLFEPEKPLKEAYHVEGVVETASAGGSAAPVEEAIPDFGTVLPKADVTAGKAVSAKCEQCHDISKGGPNKIGPELWNIIGRARATEAGFSYSSAMSSEHAPWSYELLFKYLKSPQSDGAGHQDELRRPAQRRRPHQFIRLPAHAGRFARADPGACARQAGRWHRLPPAPAASTRTGDADQAVSGGLRRGRSNA